MLYIFINKILFNKKEEITDMCNNMDKFHRYFAKQKK